MPHVTVAKLDSNERAAEVLRTSKMRWENYHGSHRIPVERLTFVRGSEHTWTDLAEIDPLGPPTVIAGCAIPARRARVDMTVFHLANPAGSNA